MNTNTMLKSKWYLVEMFTSKKCFRITVRKPLNTKVEAMEFENSRVLSHNFKSLSHLIEQGWRDLNEVSEVVVEEVKSVSETIVTTVEHIEVETINPEIEAYIIKYANEKIERDILAYEEKKRKENAVNLFLSTPPKQVKHKPFDFNKYALTDNQYKSNVKAVIGQRADYCNEVLNEDI